MAALIQTSHFRTENPEGLISKKQLIEVTFRLKKTKPSFNS